MKKRKIAKILLAAMLITGCNKAVQKPQEPANSLVERDEAVKELPYDPISLINYINENIAKVNACLNFFILFHLRSILEVKNRLSDKSSDLIH